MVGPYDTNIFSMSAHLRVVGDMSIPTHSGVAPPALLHPKLLSISSSLQPIPTASISFHKAAFPRRHRLSSDEGGEGHAKD